MWSLLCFPSIGLGIPLIASNGDFGAHQLCARQICKRLAANGTMGHIMIKIAIDAGKKNTGVFAE